MDLIAVCFSSLLSLSLADEARLDEGYLDAGAEIAMLNNNIVSTASREINCFLLYVLYVCFVPSISKCYSGRRLTPFGM